MTTEEKARAYDEALTIAKRIISKNCSEVEKLCLKSIFPELTENEDERTRRSLIDAIKIGYSNNGISFTKEAADRYIAYLEKQKYDRMQPIYDNQESFESALDKAWKSYNDSGARTVDGCEDNYTECAHAKGFREGYLFGLGKQKEQKPKFNVGDTIRLKNSYAEYTIENISDGKYYCKGCSIDIDGCDRDYELVQRKPEWSEEDEKMLRTIISDGSRGVELDSKQISWLKSLRPQPKAELTLLDENIIDAAIAFVEQNNHFSFWGGIDKHTVIKALRSLKSKWKPTDEQMEALKNSAYGSYQNGDGPILRELYEQLKKLM